MSEATVIAVPKPKSLRHRVAKAGSWVLIGHVVQQVVRLGTNVFLARLLSPDAFGLMSVVYILMIGLALFSDIGITRSVVQSRRGNDPDLLDTAWAMQIIRGLGLGAASIVVGVGFAIATHWGWTSSRTVYGDPRLPWIVGVFSIVAILQGLESMRNGVAKRDMQMKLLTKINIGSQVVAAVAMVAIAWLSHSIWALVVGAIVAGAVRCWLGHATLPGHREKFRLVPDAVAELVGNGKWIFLSSILGFVAINGDRLVLGGLIDKHSFGLYTVAFMLVNMLQVVASTLCFNVAYPAIAEVHRERARDLPGTLEKFQWLYDALVVFLASILMTAGPAIIRLLYDVRYHDAGWIMSILALGAIGLRYQIVEQAYQAMHKPQFITLANFIRLAALMLGLLGGHHFWGIKGAVWGIALSQFSTWPLAWWFKARHRIFTWRSEAALLPAIGAGALVGWVASMILAWLLPAHFLH
jgi:O-antigen/teichoic acid export membrane protein